MLTVRQASASVAAFSRQVEAATQTTPPLSDKPLVESRAMIHVTRLNHIPLVLNSDLIEHIEATPDTVISLTNGQKLVVLETTEELVRKVIEFRREIYRGIVA